MTPGRTIKSQPNLSDYGGHELRKEKILAEIPPEGGENQMGVTEEGAAMTKSGSRD